MTSRFIVSLLLGAALAGPALAAEPGSGQSGPSQTGPSQSGPAQTGPTQKDPEVPPQLAPKPDWVQPPGETPRAGRERSYTLDTLFEALKIAPDDDSARAIEQRIWAHWIVSGSDTCNLLMGRVKAATEQKDLDLAAKLLDAVIELKPNYTEAWNRRATVRYLQKDFGGALADLREVLTREPRHFGALSGLGLILQELGDEKDALEAYRRALAIDPRLENVGEAAKTLREKVEGRDI
jgi:tetratricopeptide (TPR) repeat protein